MWRFLFMYMLILILINNESFFFSNSPRELVPYTNCVGYSSYREWRGGTDYYTFKASWPATVATSKLHLNWKEIDGSEWTALNV